MVMQARRPRLRVVGGGMFALATTLMSQPAAAFEREWHFGTHVGYALSTFAEGTASGFGAGGYVNYGLTDAVNVRLQGDASIVDIPEPSTSALIYTAAVGAEYVLDTLDWVVYAGLLTGPVDVAIQDGENLWQLGAMIPFGLTYRFGEHWAVGGEGQYRLFLFGPEGSPINNLLLGGRFEYRFGM
jgi:Outer membrane protein beta-barrel domain